jgi:hypothetical protein
MRCLLSEEFESIQIHVIPCNAGKLDGSDKLADRASKRESDWRKMEGAPVRTYFEKESQRRPVSDHEMRAR